MIYETFETPIYFIFSLSSHVKHSAIMFVLKTSDIKAYILTSSF